MIVHSRVREMLQPYLPRLVLEWLASEPECRYRAVDGTVVFVDISGFTRLSERLARFGRVGAEEMSDAINACFTDLLAVAYEQDGGLIKFGGDALLLLFAGGPPEAHALRAARAAAGMRERLRTVGKLRTSGGRIDLRMSVGVHSGRFAFFLVGASHRELVVTGPSATEVVRMEGTADAGEIVISAATADLLPTSSRGKAKGSGFHLRSVAKGDAEMTAWDVPDVPSDLLQGAVPVAVRESLLAKAVEPEHRQASVAFVHFEGADDLLDREGPDALAAELDRLVRDTQEAVDAHGVSLLGSDVDADGGKLILVAGAPRAMGDDEARMLLSVRRIVEGERRLPVRIGVNQGGVFAGDIGPSYRRTYTVMGDVVNLAARLMAQAPPGEVYASAQVLERSGTRFETVELEPFMVKGKARPVQAWSVGAPVAAGRVQAREAALLPLIGRDAEMDVLEAALADARQGRAVLVEVVAEAGAGKSRLLSEIRDMAEGFTVTGATGEAFTAMTPYVAWRDMLREVSGLSWDDPAPTVVKGLGELVDAHAPSLRAWVPLIAVAADADAEPTPEVADLGAEFVRPKLHEAVNAFLSATVRTPTLFAIEDAHLFDEASAALLAAIAVADGGPRPWLFVVCRRPQDTGFVAPEHPAVRRLRLEPLNEECSVGLAEVATEEEPIAGHLLKEAVDRAGGNPQLLLDLLDAIAAGQTELPATVEAAATVRIDSLPPAERSLIRRLSVFGLAFHPRRVGDVLDEGAPLPGEGSWTRLAEFFEPEGGGYLRFRRAVIRDAAYGGLPFRTRRRLHEAVGLRMEVEAAEPEEIAGLLAMHFALAEDHPRALRYATIAARRDQEIFANVEAAAQYGRAIAAARRTGAPQEEILGLLEALGEVLLRARLLVDAKRVNAEARKLATDDPVRFARLMMKRSVVELSSGRLSQVLRWLTRARNALTGCATIEARRVEAEIDARYAAGLQAQGRNREAVLVAGRAIREGEKAGSPTAIAYAENMLGAALASLGRPGAIDHWRGSLARFEEIGDLTGQAAVLINLGAGEYLEGRWGKAVELYEQAAQVSDRLGDPEVSANSKMNVAEVLIDQGSYKHGERLLREALRVWRTIGADYDLGFCYLQLGRAAALTGRVDEALADYERSRAAYLTVGASGQILEVDARAAECRLLIGEARETLPRIQEISAELEEDAGVNLLMPLVARLRGYAMAQIGRLDDAKAAFEASVAAARARGAEHEVALSLQGLARVARLRGEPWDAIEAETVGIFDRLGIRAVPAFRMAARS